jgi:hypothetical protein
MVVSTQDVPVDRSLPGLDCRKLTGAAPIFSLVCRSSGKEMGD